MLGRGRCISLPPFNKHKVDKERLKKLLLYMVHEDNSAIGSHIGSALYKMEQRIEDMEDNGENQRPLYLTELKHWVRVIKQGLERIKKSDDYMWEQIMEMIDEQD